MDQAERQPGGGLFGRRKGHKLRRAQAQLIADLLPRLRWPHDAPAPAEHASARRPDGPRHVACLAELFLFPPRHVTLEIGFGGGEHLLAQAKAHPDEGFIGCEPFVNGLAKLLAGLEAERLANVRVWDGDAIALLPALPDSSIDRVDLLYPDPWPKRRQRKRRFVSHDSLAALARIMKPNADLRFATDVDDYAAWTLAHVLRSPDFTWTAARALAWREPWPDWSGTRYERKARREGRQPIYLTFARR